MRRMHCAQPVSSAAVRESVFLQFTWTQYFRAMTQPIYAREVMFAYSFLVWLLAAAQRNSVPAFRTQRMNVMLLQTLQLNDIFVQIFAVPLLRFSFVFGLRGSAPLVARDACHDGVACVLGPRRLRCQDMAASMAAGSWPLHTLCASWLLYRSGIIAGATLPTGQVPDRRFPLKAYADGGIARNIADGRVRNRSTSALRQSRTRRPFAQTHRREGARCYRRGPHQVIEEGFFAAAGNVQVRLPVGSGEPLLAKSAIRGVLAPYSGFLVHFTLLRLIHGEAPVQLT